MISLPTLHEFDRAASTIRIWLAAECADMRCGFDRLAAAAAQATGLDPACGNLFIFRSRCGSRIKVLYWDRDGYALWYKRLERGVFKMPRIQEGMRCVEMRASELAMLLDGIDLRSVKRSPRFVRG